MLKIIPRDLRELKEDVPLIDQFVTPFDFITWTRSTTCNLEKLIWKKLKLKADDVYRDSPVSYRILWLEDGKLEQDCVGHPGFQKLYLQVAFVL